MSYLWVHFVGTFIFLGMVILFLIFSFYISKKEKVEALIKREVRSDLPGIREINQAQMHRLSVFMLLWFLFAVAVFATVMHFHSFVTLSKYKPQFAQWVVQEYSVVVDSQKADLIECYAGVLHYPQKEGRALLPYFENPRCDESIFKKKKSNLGLDGLRDKIWVMNFIVSGLWVIWFGVLGYWRIIFKPYFDWVNKWNPIKG